MSETVSTDLRELDAVVVGAGFSGLYMLHRLRDTLGLSARVLEAADDVGGTWYWNRYPGARCDSESYFYSFSDRLSEDLLQEWTWSERFAGPAGDPALPADRRRPLRPAPGHPVRHPGHGRRLDDDAEPLDGRHRRRRRGHGAVPRSPRSAACRRRTCPTSRAATASGASRTTPGCWPHEGVDFTGKRVAVIGTGATGVQADPGGRQRGGARLRLPAHAQLRPRRRQPPAGPRLRPQDQGRLPRRSGRATRETAFGFPYDVADRSALAVSEEERQRIFEEAGRRAASVSSRRSTTCILDEEANETAAEFVRDKIRERVNDPEIAEMLAPKDHPFITKRPPLENGYYETFNRDNVTLVDVAGPRSRRSRRAGCAPPTREYEVDSIVYATGFDAMTGTPVQARHQGTGRARPRGEVGRGPAHLPRDRHPRVPEPVHDHRAAEPVGAEQHARLDRAARRLDH